MPKRLVKSCHRGASYEEFSGTGELGLALHLSAQLIPGGDLHESTDMITVPCTIDCNISRS
jgi:hypothetical protein